MQDGLSSDEARPRGQVLFVDDDADVLQAAHLLLRRHSIGMSQARSPAEAWSALAAEPIDVVLLDLNFSRGATSGEDGLRLLTELKAHDPDAVVVVVTGHSGVNVAVAAMQAGATDFVTKPWSNARLVATLQSALELRRGRRETAALKAENAALTREVWGEDTRLLGASPAIARVRDLIRRAAPTDAPVLIYGEAGTGKSLMARMLHLRSARAGTAFVPVDLSVLDGPSMETALFGGGDATGAQPGALATARGGALFLDEVGALTGPVQARLLSAFQAHDIGAASKPSPGTDVRIVCATRRRRDELHGRGGLKHDLLYRLNTVEIFAPPLRERGDDALILAEHFLRMFSRRYGKPTRRLASEAAAAIVADPWPGDVRALRQAMERCVILAESDVYRLSDIPFTDRGDQDPHRKGPSLVETERAQVAAALKRNSFNVSHAARDLGLTRAALYRRMAKHGL